MEIQKQKILLIEPPFYRLFKKTYSFNRYPLSLGYLSGAIEKHTDWETVTFNADFAPKSEMMKMSYLSGKGFESYLENLQITDLPVWDEVKNMLSKHKPQIVGISAKTQNFASACIVARLAKELNQDTLVIVGGPHPSCAGSEALSCSDIDICVRGEGEKTIVELLEAIDSNRDINTVKGILYRKDSKVFETEPREYMEDLDNLAFPHCSAATTLDGYNEYPVTAFRNVIAIRGCPYNCFFCGSRNIWSRSPRFRSPDNIVEEIKALQAVGLKSISFIDDTFGVNHSYINQLCGALIKSCPDIKWDCELHVKLVNDATISLMKQAGCHTIFLGIESGSNMILDKMRKNITIEETYKACEVIKRHRLDLYAFFMIGFPYETEESIRDTLKAMCTIKSDWITFSIFTPYPGTEAFELCKQRGLIGDEYDVSLYNHQSPANHFCFNITAERFRELVIEMEKFVDNKNRFNKYKKLFSLNTIWRIQELGLYKSLKKSKEILFGS